MYIDIDAGLGRVRGNKPLYKRMLGMFLDSSEIGDFERYIKDKSYEEASNSAHAIKGIAGNLGMSALFEISGELVEELRRGSVNQERILEYTDILEKTLAAAGETIERL